MKLVRTTLRLHYHLKKAAEQKALNENMTLQALFNQALRDFLKEESTRKVKKMNIATHDLGAPLDGLKRSDFYE